MKPNRKLKWIYVGGLCALALAPVGAAIARPTPCITDETTCDYNLLCAFKIELAEKILLYETFVANTPATKKAGSFQGVTYNGSVYQASLSEGEAAAKAAARSDGTTATAEDIASAQYKTFAEKVRAKLQQQAAQYKDCSSLMVTPNETLRGTWSGMHTSKSDCTVYGDLGTGDARRSVTPDELLDQTNGCREIYDSDRGHERVHESVCKPGVFPNKLQGYVDEDIQAYRFSVQSAANDLQKLQTLCSSDANSSAFRMRAADLLAKAAKYQQLKKAGK